MRYIITALLGLYTMTLATPVFAGKDCSCDKTCQENCANGKGENCKCKTCDCKKTGKCKHGKCHHKHEAGEAGHEGHAHEAEAPKAEEKK